MTGNDFAQAIARYRLHLSFFAFIALALEWRLDDGGRPHPLASLTDLEHPLGMGLVERFLAKRFGDAWQRYAAATPAFLPRFRAAIAPGDWRARHWWRNREWRIVVRIVAVIALLEWWNGVTRGG